MLKTVICLLFLFLSVGESKGQKFPIDTIQYKGNSNQYIDFVLMGDGYVASEQSAFIATARALVDYLFSLHPWKNYRDYFNIFAIKVVSPQSGIPHPGTAADCGFAPVPVPVSKSTSYFGCTFDYRGVHRLVAPANFQAVKNVLSENFPKYNQVHIIANSKYTGGSGSEFPVSTVEPVNFEVAAHELGHSFANLADEYWQGPSEKPNMTQQSDPRYVKWRNWLGINEIGIYPYGTMGEPASWFRPHQACKMSTFERPYCSVCAEAIVERIHELVPPTVLSSPDEGNISSKEQFIQFKISTLLRPVPNTFRVTWKLDGVTVAHGIDSITIDQNTLSKGNHNLVATVLDTNTSVRITDHFEKHALNMEWILSKNNFNIFPNPTNRLLNIDVRTVSKKPVSFSVFSFDGKLMKEVNGIPTASNNTYQLDVADLPPGAYTIRFDEGGFLHSQIFIKK
jgi:hypothetical protein